jgi:thiol:disulfide interchange protein
LSRVWQAPELYNREIGIPAGERLHQQLGSILKEAVQPMRQGMREIYQQSLETAKRLVWELAGRAVGTIRSEHTSQVCQQAKILIPPSTDEERCEQAQQIWEMEQGMQQRRLEEQKNMAQRIWEILGLPQRS